MIMQHKSQILEQQYNLRFSEHAEYRNRVWQVLCEQFFSRYIAADSKVLDLGSGWGEFINNIAAADKYAMDLNSSSGAHLLPGITCINQDCSMPWEMASGFLDVVFTSNFLEHLSDKAGVERTISEASRCLKPGGLLICMGPNLKFVGGAYWDFWDHHIPLTEQSCAELLRLNYFSIEQCIPRFLPYSMSNGTRPPTSLIKYYLRLPFLWPLFGKQFLVIGCKPSTAGGQL
jgi:SAM-dependent methyltransferase